MVCLYRTARMGFCSKYIKEGDRCEKHFGLKGEIRFPQKKFRGDSKFQKEQAMFTNKGE